MLINEIICEDRECLLSHLKGHVFHLTTREAYVRIIEAGKISNNKTGQFRVNPSSQNSYGRLHGYVCLFDLRNDTPEIIQKALDCYYFLGPRWFEEYDDDGSQWNLVYLLLDPKYHDRIVSNSVVLDPYKKTGGSFQWIPQAEVWIRDHLPLNWIEKTLIVTIQQRHPDLSTQAGTHFWAVQNADREERKEAMALDCTNDNKK